MSSYNQIDIIEKTGREYDQIIFEDDNIPSEIFVYQIRRRNQKLASILKDKKYNLTLDLGCGTGYHRQMLIKSSNMVIGADISLVILSLRIMADTANTAITDRVIATGYATLSFICDNT